MFKIKYREWNKSRRATIKIIIWLVKPMQKINNLEEVISPLMPMIPDDRRRHPKKVWNGNHVIYKIHNIS